MQKPLSAYLGDEQFAFVCYSHQDAKHIYSDLIALQKQSLKVWYDEGIAAGSSWRAEIANAIKKSSAFVFFISRHSLASAHCIREVDYALNINKKVIPVYLENIALPPELELSLQRIHAISRYKNTDYLRHLVTALGVTNKTFTPSVSSVKTSWLVPVQNIPRMYWVATVLLVILVISSAVFFTNTQTPLNTNNSNKVVSTSSSTMDIYQQATALLSRWDKPENISSAIELLNQAIKQQDDFVLAHTLLAEAFRIQYTLKGDKTFIDEAISHTNKALSIDPNYAAAYVASARVNLSQGNIDKAYSTAIRALEIDPVSATANQAMALVHQRQSRFDDAKQYFEKAVLLAPDNIVILDSYANFLFDFSEYANALRFWEKALNIAPDHYAVLVNKGSALLELSRYQEAITAFKQALAIKPSYAVYMNLGVALDQTENLQEAIDNYQKAIEIADNDWLVWGNMALTMEKLNGLTPATLKTYQQAILLAEKEREYDQRSIWANIDLALYYSHIQETTLAIERLNTALILAPNMSEVLIVAAQVYQQVGNPQRASEFISQAIEQEYPIDKIKQIDALKPLITKKS